MHIKRILNIFHIRIIVFNFENNYINLKIYMKQMQLVFICHKKQRKKFDVRVIKYTQKNLIKSNQNQIVFTIFRLIWNQSDVRLVPNQIGAW